MKKAFILFFNLSLGFLFILALIGCVSTNRLNLFPAQKAEPRTPQATSDSVGVVILEDASIFKNVYALSDVHGMYTEAVALLRAGSVVDQNLHWSAGSSLLVIVGDSIDKGPQSIEVLDFWMRLQSEARLSGGDLLHVLGNHEAEFLADPTSKKAKELLDELAQKNIPTTELTSTNTARGRFLHDEPVAAKIGKWLFCHSGFYPEMNWDVFVQTAQNTIQNQDYGNPFLSDDQSILEAKDWEKHGKTLNPLLARLDGLGVYGDLFGHQPGAFGIEGRSAAKAGGRLIKIDNGLPPEAGSHPGSLLVFTDPAQMNQAQFPQIKIIFPNQTSADLQPE